MVCFVILFFSESEAEFSVATLRIQLYLSQGLQKIEEL